MSDSKENENVLALRHYSQSLHLVRLKYKGAKTAQDEIDPVTIEKEYAPYLREYLLKLISGELSFATTSSVTVATLQQMLDKFDTMLHNVQDATNDSERFTAVNDFYSGLLQYLESYESETSGGAETTSELAARLFPKSRPDGPKRPK